MAAEVAKPRGEPTVSLATGRDIALAILVIEAIVLSLLPLALFYYAIRGMRSLRSWLDPKIPTAQAQLARIAHAARTISDYMVGPVLGVSARRRQAQATIQALLHRPSSAGPPETQDNCDPLTGERGAV